MDLSRHLRHFLAVAEEMHFGRAAEALGIAQPPLSQSVQRLERELGVVLFDRSRRAIALTPAGRLLCDEARALLLREERLRAVMRRARDGELGALRAGVPADTPAPVLRALLEAMAEHAPGLEVDLQELTTAEQVRMLAAAHLDVGLLHHPVEAPDAHLGPTADIPLGAVLARTSPLARSAEVAPADLAGHDLVAFPRATAPGAYDHLLAACRAAGFSPARVRHAGNPEFLLGLVLADRGVALEPEALARREPRAAWRPLKGRPLVRRIGAAWPREAPHPAAAQFARVAVGLLAPPEPPAPPIGPAERPWSVVYTPPERGPGADRAF
ncbi:LysR family transcriptional regulator [Streptomonospora sp. S1-112]|uniref:LysR family transcriptional regulator n=1 Tax=Streptomonospora mangrovi TaxID=2883123 RepID=A0A9X3NM66_9ACTN|nr:LysR family transcriptional regulator [Streptomonospora mangrovi]MDA0566314.1 LysR family transcriptional regulator [Streptomonospora mangrovi]